ncbi:hypothetical protein [Halalkalibacter akibai]|nr:hypothetical protein [Halalkalibacter akibai]
MKLVIPIILLVMCVPSLCVQAAELESLENVKIVPLQSTGVVNISPSRNMEVNYDKKEDWVYVECFVDGFKFTENKVGSLHQEGEGHIRLYINDEHVDTLFQPAFIIENLPEGEHVVKVVVVKNDRSPYDLEESFTVKMER